MQTPTIICVQGVQSYVFVYALFIYSLSGMQYSVCVCVCGGKKDGQPLVSCDRSGYGSNLLAS